MSNIFKSLRDKYMPDCSQSIVRNRHMNKCTAPLVDESKGARVIDEFIEGLPEIVPGTRSVGSVLDLMAEHAKEMARNRTPDEEWDALVVDFINFVGMMNCCDYAMYTSDLRR